MYFLLGNNVCGDMMIYVLLFIADVIWGLNIVVTKLNYDSFHPLFLIFFKIFFSLIAMLVIVKFKHYKLEKPNITSVLINTNLINVLNFLLTYFALQNVTGVISATINCLAPFIMMIITFFDSKKINKKTILLFLISLFGFLCTIEFKITFLSLGHFLLILALFIYNLGNFRLKKIKNMNIFVYNSYMLLIALFEIIFICLFFDNLIYRINTFYLWLFIFTSGFGYAYIQSVYFYSIQKIGPLKTSVFLGLSPIFTYLFSIMILKEKVNFYLIAGFAIILSSSIYFLIHFQHHETNIHKF